MLEVRKWVFALDMYQLLERCQALVFNLDGRTPDDGSVVETAAAFTAGKPIVIFKTTPITMLAGADNPMVEGLSTSWTSRDGSGRAPGGHRRRRRDEQAAVRLRRPAQRGGADGRGQGGLGRAGGAARAAEGDPSGGSSGSWRSPRSCSAAASRSASSARPRSASPREASDDLPHVPVIGAAAAAQDGELRQLGAQLCVTRAEVDRIALVELLGLVQLRVALARGVGAQTANPVAAMPLRCRARPRSGSGARS